MSRAARHAQLRAEGHGDELDRIIVLMDAHRASLQRVVDLAAIHPDHYQLRQLARKARGGISQIDRDLDDPAPASPWGTLAFWGRNLKGPNVYFLLLSAEWHAANPIQKDAA